MNAFSTLLKGRTKLDDWLSPILVKELRQGMRARAFVASFLLLQASLILLVLGNVAAQADRVELNLQNGFFWVIIGIALLALLPLRGLGAISQEVKGHTLETMMLTRLTAWRVVFGKWSALFAQSLLFVSAVLPYVFLRYFIGGDDVVSDFKLLLFLLWLSGLLIAATIAVSALGNAIIRVILVFLGFIVLEGGSELFRPGSGFEDSWKTLVWIVLFGFFIPGLLFELTASSFAPGSENHAIRRRLLALVFFLFAAFFTWVSRDFSGSVIYVPLTVLIIICCFELAEKPKVLWRLVRPWQQRGWISRSAGLFLLPGWPSGLLFSLVVIPFGIFLNYRMFSPSSATTDRFPALLLIFAIFGSILIPILVCHLLWPKMKQVALVILIFNMALFALSSLLNGFANLTHANLDPLVGFLPSLPILTVFGGSDSKEDFHSWSYVGNTFTLLLVVIILLVASRRYFADLLVLVRSNHDVVAVLDQDRLTTPS